MTTDDCYFDEPPPQVRLEICKQRRAHIYAPSRDVREFTALPDGTFQRCVPCTSCGIAVRIEIWDLQFDDTGKVTTARLRTHYPGVVTPATVQLRRKEITAELRALRGENPT